MDKLNKAELLRWGIVQMQAQKVRGGSENELISNAVQVRKQISHIREVFRAQPRLATEPGVKR